MKKSIHAIIALSLALTPLNVLPVSAEEVSAAPAAASETESDLVYSYDDSTMTATVTGINMEASIADIPETVIGPGGNTYTVTAIGQGAFFGLDNIISVRMPDTITTIGNEAFDGCWYLNSVQLSNSITTIPENAFNGCRRLTDITIPNSVTSIGESAFMECQSLASIDIPTSVTSIGDYAFARCTSLTSIILPDSVTYLGERVFSECSGLKYVYYSAGIQEIEYCFDFAPLTEKMPDSLVEGTTCAQTVLLPIGKTSYHLMFTENIQTVIGWTPLTDLPDDLQGYIDLHNLTYIDNSQIILDKQSYIEGDTVTLRSWPMASITLNGQTLDQTVWIDGTAQLNNTIVGENTLATTNKYGQTSTVTFMVISGAVTGITLDKSDVSLVQKETEQLTPTITPAYALNKTVNWTSSNPDVATVDENGLVTAVNPGEADIIATTLDGGYTASCKVTVSPILVQSVSLSKRELSLMKGTTETLSATVLPEDAFDKTLTWTSSNPDIVQVDKDGNITAMEEGEAAITVTTNDGKYTAQCDVTVTEIVPASIELDKHELTLTVEDKDTLSANVLPENAKNKNVTWTSSNSNIVSVDDKGNIEATGVGTATIQVQTEKGNVSDECIVTVNPIPVSKIELDNTALNLNTGDSKTLSATISPSNATDKTIVWTSDNEDVATVENGTIKALSQGTATITAASLDGHAAAQCTVTVKDIPVAAIALNKKTAYLERGSTYQLIAEILPSNATHQELVWTSSDPDNVEVSETGLVTMKGHGNAAITVSAKDNPSIQAQCQIIEFVTVTSIQLDKSELTLTEKGEGEILTAEILPSNATVKDMKWISSNPETATVDAKGNVIPLKAGTAYITVTASGGYSDVCKVTVKTPSKDEDVALNETSLYLESGSKKVIKAINTESNTEADVSWTSSDEKVATVDASGKVTIVGSGTATITAKTTSGKMATCTVYGYTKQEMHRLYNPNSGEHFYTASTEEKDNLVSVGWKYEGTAWIAPSYSDTPVYRLYNPNAGDHHYTTSAEERDMLVSVGWKYEGIGWYSDSAKTTALHRLYNPNAIAGAHHYTTSSDEKDMLVKAGWKYENYGWYGLK